MKRKTIFLIILFLIVLCGCNESKQDNNDQDEEPIDNPSYVLLKGLILDNEPNKVDYYYDEELDFTGLRVFAEYDNNTAVECKDYEIIHNDLVIGDNIITIKNEYYIVNFVVHIHDYERINVNGHLNYSKQTTMKLSIDDASLIFYDIQNGGSRTKDTFVVYDESNRINTNIYGYEIAVDKYGKVIDKNVNVELPNGGYVLSAHGTRVPELKNINLGDYVFYDTNLYVFKETGLTNNNEAFLLFNELLEDINDIENNKQYNEVVERINELIPSLDSLYKEYDEVLCDSVITELENISDSFDRFDWTTHTHTYNYADIDCSELSMEYEGSKKYILYATYDDGDIIYGGYREKDRLAYYDNGAYYRTRNTAGYEVAINDKGIVIQCDTLVEIPENGFILSGHGVMKEYLQKYVKLDDKIEIVDGIVYIYRKISEDRFETYLNYRNEIVSSIKAEIDKEVPHDYEFINEILEKIDEILIKFKSDNNLWSSQENNKLVCVIETYAGLIESNLTDNITTIDKGFWYCPFSNGTRDDNIENIQKAMQEFKEMGITELIVSPYYQEKLVYKSSIYQSHEFDDVYGEYGNDYLACLIGEAHKVNIKINMFTATFRERISSMLEPDESFYQLDYYGNKSLGGTNYYDICNDNVQKLQIDWYIEMVSNYDIDKLEYDIIRYPSNNLHDYLDVETIPSSVEIIDHGYTEYSMNKFMTSHGYTGDLKQLIRENKKIRNEWFEFQTAGVNDFVKNATAALKAIDEDIIITAAVFNNWEGAEKSVHQCYHLWLDNGWIDQAEPMMYTAIIDEFIDMIDNNYDEEYGKYIRAGIGARLDENNYYKDFLELKLSEKCNGYIMFRAGYYLKDSTFIKMMKMNHHNITVKNLDYDEKIKASCDDMIDMIENYYRNVNNKKYNDLIGGLKTYDIEVIRSKINVISDELMKEYLCKYLDMIAE